MIRRALGFLLPALCLSAASWLTPLVSHPSAAQSQTAPVASAEVRGSEARQDAVQRATDVYRAVPALPGQRPPFLPRRAVSVKRGHVGVCSLGPALAGRCGSVLAWVP